MMKKFVCAFSLLLAVFLVPSILGIKVYAQDMELDSGRCPGPPNRNFISICGFVKSAVPTYEEGVNKTIIKSQQPVQNVSVHLYECDNSSPSCKNNGNLVNPFSTTWTNEDGRFHLVARKLDNPVELMGVMGVSPSPDGKLSLESSRLQDAVVQSKRRYLVFTCGERFAGLQVLPSFQSMPQIIQEVRCTDNNFSYKDPTTPFKFVSSVNTLAAQMGYAEGDILGTGSDPNKTIQAVYASDPPLVHMDMFLMLEGADPRFTVIASNDYIGMIDGSLGHTPNPEEGAFWSIDCTHKYAGTYHADLCMYGVDPNKQPTQAIWEYGLMVYQGDIYFRGDNNTPLGYPIMSLTNFINMWEGGEGSRELAIMLYEMRLYHQAKFLVQNKLPNIPPRNAILFYKEFPARQDLTQYIQDPTDIARFLNAQYSNCIGKVFLRYDSETKTSYYISCDGLKRCNKTISGAEENNYTTGGPARWMSSPTEALKQFTYVDLNTPVCTINPQDEGAAPVRIKDIQPSWDLGTGEGYILDKTYWNPELLLYFGQNNFATKAGHRFASLNDSYTAPKDAIDKEIFSAFREAAGIEIQDGTSPIIPSDKKQPNNSAAAASYIIGQSLTNFFGSPTKAMDPTYKDKITSNFTIYSLGGQARSHTLYSNVNQPSEMIITEPSQDLAPYNNIYFGAPPGGNSFHYPWDDFNAPTFGLLGFLGQIKDFFIDVFKIGPTRESTLGYAAQLGASYNADDGWLYRKEYDGLSLTDVKWMSYDEFKSTYKDQIMEFQKGYDEKGPRLRDGTRTPTSALFFTSPAYRRVLALFLGIEGGQSELVGNDFIDSLYSAMVGGGILAPEYKIEAGALRQLQALYEELGAQYPGGALEEETSEATFQAITRAVAEVIAGRWDEIINNKTFFDRERFDYGVPGAIDDLKARFALSEENFIEEFPLPEVSITLTPYGLANTGSRLLPEDWGDHACYPWTQVALNEICDTSKVESEQDISRTCRVDLCTKTTTKVKCECVRSEGLDPVTGGSVYNYSVQNCPQNVVSETDKVVVNISDEKCMQPDNALDIAKRLVCAQRQKTCYDGVEVENQGIVHSNLRGEQDCIRRTYEGDIKGKRDDMIRNEDGRYCSANNFQNQPIYVLSVPIEGSVNASIVGVDSPGSTGTPSCIDSAAGPYACNGLLIKDSRLEVEQQELRSDPTATVDDIAVVDNELRMMLDSPKRDLFDINFTAVSHGLYSSDSSVRPPHNFQDPAKGKDSFGIGGSNINSGIVRSLFSAPAAKDAIPKFNPYSIVCMGSELGGGGNWICETQDAPDPEVVDLTTLSVDGSCALNMSEACRKLVFSRTLTLAQSGEQPMGTCGGERSNSCNGNEGSCGPGGGCATGSSCKPIGFEASSRCECYVDNQCPSEVTRAKVEYEDVHFSDSFYRVISAAATQFKVPASMLLSYMAGIGQLHKYEYYWSQAGEEKFILASAPWYGTFPRCDDMAIGAEGPYDWLLYWFNLVLSENQSGQKGALDSISQNRSRTASRCNFLDASYLAAANLNEIGGFPGSCSAWSLENAAAALNAMTFGNDPAGAYATDGRFFGREELKNIFELCK